MPVDQTYLNARADAHSVREKEVFDIATLDSITKNNPAQRTALAKLVSTLIETSGQDLTQAQNLFLAGEASSALKLLHTLRGAVGNLGAKRFAAASLALEGAIQQESAMPAVHFDMARAELDLTLSFAKTWLAQVSPKT